MKDPAFLFYSSDFLNGIADLTMEERGQFITLLCLQHQKNELSEKTIRLSVGNVSVDVLHKFRINENGNFVNKRLFEEIEKRRIFTESRRNNGQKGGRPLKNNKPSGKPKDNHMENENENENKDIIVNKNKSEKNKKTKIAKTENLEIAISDPMSEIWATWTKYKFDQFKFKFKSKEAEVSAKSLLLNLSKGSESTAAAIVAQSMANGWHGLFQLKYQGGSPNVMDLSKPERNKITTMKAYDRIINKLENENLITNEN